MGLADVYNKQKTISSASKQEEGDHYDILDTVSDHGAESDSEINVDSDSEMPLQNDGVHMPEPVTHSIPKTCPTEEEDKLSNDINIIPSPAQA